ncbi:hypothetical protein ISCGN_005855, partial [Ixodes scapularis]
FPSVGPGEPGQHHHAAYRAKEECRGYLSHEGSSRAASRRPHAPCKHVRRPQGGQRLRCLARQAGCS